MHHHQLQVQDIQDRGAHRVTTPLRTLMDVAHIAISPEHLQAAVVKALRSGLVRARTFQRAMCDADLPEPVRKYVQAVLEQV